MPRLLVLQHLDLEGPSRFADLAVERGWTVEIRHLHRGEPVPTAIDDGTVLLVMGGPMGVGDIGDSRWPFLAAEATLLRRVIAERKPVIGVCLGAQLLAHAAGASVHPIQIGFPAVRHREVGWGAITFEVDPADTGVLAGMDPSEVVVHWHGDTFDLPAGATRLASTLACPNQFFALGKRAFGLQFHIEITASQVQEWIVADAAFVHAAGGDGLAQRIREDTVRWMPRHRRQGDRLIRNLFDACSA